MNTDLGDIMIDTLEPPDQSMPVPEDDTGLRKGDYKDLKSVEDD